MRPTECVRRAMYVLLIGATALGAGCAGPPRRPAVPAGLQERAVVPGFGPEIRTYVTPVNEAFLAELRAATMREAEAWAAAGHAGPLPRAEFLAISGGGQNGAFTAGLLNGWTDSGTRPEFKVVTGISTGALIAPFAFLGSSHDATLREAYTKTRTPDILIPRPLLAALTSDALADNQPLWRMVERQIDQRLLDEIAAEYAKGRILVVGTTDLDARRGVIWNVTAIAASRHPQALPLVRKILVASAAIPAAFPPVMIDVEVDGRSYQELHVDGGAMAQLFLYPPSMKIKELAAAAGIVRERRAYVVRNARLDPDWAQTERRTLPIAVRAIDSLLHTQGIGDLYRTYVNAQRDDVDYNLAFIPATFRVRPKEAFDPAYMQALFDVGYELARNGYPWQKTPPGFEADANP